MAVTNADIAAIPTYTDAELLSLARSQIVQILASGQAYGIDGRSLTRTDLPKIQQFIEWIEARVDEDESDFGDGIALVQFGNPV